MAAVLRFSTNPTRQVLPHRSDNTRNISELPTHSLAPTAETLPAIEALRRRILVFICKDLVALVVSFDTRPSKFGEQVFGGRFAEHRRQPILERVSSPP